MIKSLSYLVLICFFGVLVIALIVLLTGCVDTNRTLPSKPRFSGDHTTANIRGMWHVCYSSRTRTAPHIPPLDHVIHCDCLVDSSRERMKFDEYTALGNDNLTKFFSDLSTECTVRRMNEFEPHKSDPI